MRDPFFGHTFEPETMGDLEEMAEHVFAFKSATNKQSTAKDSQVKP